jgi:hypothetical protein
MLKIKTSPLRLERISKEVTKIPHAVCADMKLAFCSQADTHYTFLKKNNFNVEEYVLQLLSSKYDEGCI